MVSVPPEPGKVKLLDRVREAIRFKHYSLRTERTYIDWIKRFIIYHGKRHPETMGADEVRRFLNNLANPCNPRLKISSESGLLDSSAWPNNVGGWHGRRCI